jgi:hypothetical protein
MATDDNDDDDAATETIRIPIKKRMLHIKSWRIAPMSSTTHAQYHRNSQYKPDAQQL